VALKHGNVWKQGPLEEIMRDPSLAQELKEDEVVVEPEEKEKVDEGVNSMLRDAPTQAGKLIVEEEVSVGHIGGGPCKCSKNHYNLSVLT
jgi:hypothetical protein